MQASNAHTHAHMHTLAHIPAQTLNPTESLFLGLGRFHSCSLKLPHSDAHKREVRWGGKERVEGEMETHWRGMERDREREREEERERKGKPA